MKLYTVPMLDTAFTQCTDSVSRQSARADGQLLVAALGDRALRPTTLAPYGLDELRSWLDLHGLDPSNVIEAWLTASPDAGLMLLQVRVMWKAHPHFGPGVAFVMWDGPTGERDVASELRLMPLLALPGQSVPDGGVRFKEHYTPWLESMGLSSMSPEPARIARHGVSCMQYLCDEQGALLVEDGDLRTELIEIPWCDAVRKGRRGYLPPPVRRVYDALRRKGYSKKESAKIAYAVVHHTVDRRRGRKRKR